jgi:hypothetical protein
MLKNITSTAEKNYDTGHRSSAPSREFRAAVLIDFFVTSSAWGLFREGTNGEQNTKAFAARPFREKT